VARPSWASFAAAKNKSRFRFSPAFYAGLFLLFKINGFQSRRLEHQLSFMISDA